MSKLDNIKKSIVLILGLGESGCYSAIWYYRQGARLRIADTKTNPIGLDNLRSLVNDDFVEYNLGCGNDFRSELLDGVSLVILSPGLSPNSSVVKNLIDRAVSINVEVIGEIEVFARALQYLKYTKSYSPNIIAVTGTNGKTTVTSLTYKILNDLGISVKCAGNIGPAAIKVLMDVIDGECLPSIWVLELSSFQINCMSSLHPNISVILNLTQDHIDWHGSKEDYWKSKIKLLMLSKIALINRSDPIVLKMSNKLNNDIINSFGVDEPIKSIGDVGISLKNQQKWLVCNCKNNFLVNNSDGSNQNNLEYLLPASSLRIKGLHNILNVLASIQLCKSVGLKINEILPSLVNYTGEPHRIQWVCEVNQVNYIDDSKSTNVASTIAALESIEAKSVLILGGLGKNQNFLPLIPTLINHARAIVLIGTTSLEISILLSNTSLFYRFAHSMEEAVEISSKLAYPGDTVLLSPACSSFDMFDGYVQRSKVFIECVKSLLLRK
ncbi:UDP-N-acetylmuramoylalanine--D-glutamate ligase [Candidatus Kinetoplastibacterium oncopeltii TCC290E]|uniref:UDP-N-acetylmuramoylalanine--D-glutamate ligase n=1 Tax=Candidatus Kinetoplastidibacterium stringomonadis TCC290E TaxID=1208920 RepID=M1M9B3_9PROT|nr:UDP-N-acetylmuramoyl-L-alanine--D-glutamate ligase [Candidatus Kinetoplastibacterium oncopeltii]AGF48555.1 UDP-N-acetylmuramoylalanine--D-glutamate ligase [Candidatus Kinetoplastibacterium oncopeltii TCC290E]